MNSKRFIFEAPICVEVELFVLHRTCTATPNLCIVKKLIDNYKKSPSYVCNKPKNEQLAKIGSFQINKRYNSKRCTVEVRLGIFIENLTVFLFLRAVVNISIQTSKTNNFAMTVISQDDHLTVGAWARC